VLQVYGLHPVDEAAGDADQARNGRIEVRGPKLHPGTRADLRETVYERDKLIGHKGGRVGRPLEA